jgi:hypothetical protein
VNLHHALVRHLDVGGLQVAVNDPDVMGGFERLRNLQRDRQCLLEWNWTLLDPLGERRPVDELEDERMHAVGYLEAMNRRDAWMAEGRQQLRLTLEARQPIGIVSQMFRQDLERDTSIQPSIARAIHLAHAAGAERRHDLEGPEPAAG